jgi:hypothetical protein
LEQKNVYIDSVWLDNPVNFIGQQNRFFIRVHNASNTALDGSRMTMTLNGKSKGLADLHVAPNESAIDTISLTMNEAGWNDAVFAINDYPINFDDQYYTTFRVQESLKVLNIEQGVGNKYLQALFANTPFFTYQRQDAGAVDYSSIAKQELVILNNLENISGGLAEELQKFVSGGGNLLIFPAEKAKLENYNTAFKRLNISPFTAPVNAEKEISAVNTEENIFKDVFDHVPKNLSLPKTKFSFGVQKSTGSSAEQLLSFKDGSSFLNKYTLGLGRIYVFSTPLDEQFTDLPTHAVFVPMLFKMAVVGRSDMSIAYPLRSDTRILLQGQQSSSDKVFVVTGKKLEVIPDQMNVTSGLQLNLRGQITEAGIYHAALKTSPEAAYRFALNFDRRESELKNYNKEELEQHYGGQPVHILSADEHLVAASVKELDQGTSLWKLCLIFALLFLALEIALIRFLKD